MFHSLSLVEKLQSYYEKNSKNYYYQKNYFIFKLPIYTPLESPSKVIWKKYFNFFTKACFH